MGDDKWFMGYDKGESLNGWYNDIKLIAQYFRW